MLALFQTQRPRFRLLAIVQEASSGCLWVSCNCDCLEQDSRPQVRLLYGRWLSCLCLTGACSCRIFTGCHCPRSGCEVVSVVSAWTRMGSHDWRWIMRARLLGG
jgi:hypothetical protein